MINAAIVALLEATRSGSVLDRDLLRPIFGDRVKFLSPEDMDGLRTQLDRLMQLSPHIALSLVKGAITQGEESFLRRMRDKPEVIQRLFTSVKDRGPFSLAVRSAFGVLSPAHERALRLAIEHGSFTKNDASETYYNGEEVTKRLRGFNVVETALSFRTVDFQGMPTSAVALEDLQFLDIVDIKTPGHSFRMVVSNESELRQASHPEEDTIQWLQKTVSPGSVFIDVGANIGFYSLYAACLDPTVRVISYEPSPFTFAHLCMNIQLNKTASIMPYPFAVSDTTEIAEFGLLHTIPGGWSHPGILPPGEFDKLRIGCPLFRLDDVIPRIGSPTHLKIDVDGADLNVLRGARRILALPSLTHLLIELSDERTAEAKSILQPLGFKLVNHRVEGFCNRIYAKFSFVAPTPRSGHSTSGRTIP